MPESEITDNYDGFASPWYYSGRAPHLRISGGTGLLTSKASNGRATTTTWLFRIGQIEYNAVTPVSGNTYELRVGLKDADNYVSVRFRWISYNPGNIWSGIYPHSIIGIQMFERIAGVENAICDEFQYTTRDAYAPSDAFRLCIVRGEGVGDYYYDCGRKDELLLTCETVIPYTQNFTMRGTISDISALGGKHAIYIATLASPATQAQIYWVRAKQHDEDCSQCDCLFCEIGTSPERLRARFVDLDGTHPAWFDDWHTYIRGSFWTFVGLFGVERWPSACAYWCDDEDTGYFPFILLNPSTDLFPTVSSVYWYALYFNGMQQANDIAQSALGGTPFDCCDVLDGLELQAQGTRPYLFSYSTISSSSSNSVTIADDWSMVASGRQIRLTEPFGLSTENYTVVSVSGSGPTVITVLESIPGDRTGWNVSRWATLEIEVVE